MTMDVSPDSLVVGEVYYAAGFYDRDRRVPFVRPLVFIGRNLARDDEGSARRWYFQDYESYSEGSSIGPDAVRPEGMAAPDIVMYPTDKDLSVHNLETVVHVLAECLNESRRRSQAPDS
jgi:hypothetical protein